MNKPTIGCFTIYTKSNCNYCNKVKELLTGENVVTIDCDEEDRDLFIQFIDKLTTYPHRTFPYVFKDLIFIGGFDETKKYYEATDKDKFCVLEDF